MWQRVGLNITGVGGIKGTQEIFEGMKGVIASCVFEVANQSALSAIPRIRVIDQSASGQAGPGVPPTLGINVQYINLATGAISAAGTPITANGIYGVYCPGCAVEMISSAGVADVEVQGVIGRVF